MYSNYPASTRQQTVGVTGMPISKPFQLKAMFRLLAAVIIACLMGLLYFGYREWQATQNLAGLLQKINVEDQEFSDTSPASIPNRNKAVEAWSKVCVLSRNVMPGLSYLNQLPIIGKDTRTNFAPGQPWKEEPFVAETLEYLKPILDQIELAAEHPFPSPTSSQTGWNRSSDYNLVQNLIQILQLEISHAIYHKKHVRALNGLRLLLKIGQQPENRGDFAYDIVLSTQHIAVLQSLANAEWTESEIKELEQMLSSVSNIGDKLKYAARLTRRELANHLAEPTPSIWGQPELEPLFAKLPSYRLRTLASADQLVRETRPGFQASMVGAAIPFSDNQRQHNIFAINADQFRHHVVPIFVGSEYARRLAITGVALKRFQISNGKWPKQLSELKSMGLTESDYSTPSGQLFKYEVGVLKKEELELLQLSGAEEASREYAWIWIPESEISTEKLSNEATRPLMSVMPGNRFPAYRIR
jgi:hypothetical protein